MNHRWKYTLETPRTGVFETDRDAFAANLKASKWFQETTNGEEDTELWMLWDFIKDAETVSEFDVALSELYDLADYDKAWITFKR
jgi:hypothetical protein